MIICGASFSAHDSHMLLKYCTPSWNCMYMHPIRPHPPPLWGNLSLFNQCSAINTDKYCNDMLLYTYVMALVHSTRYNYSEGAQIPQTEFHYSNTLMFQPIQNIINFCTNFQRIPKTHLCTCNDGRIHHPLKLPREHRKSFCFQIHRLYLPHQLETDRSQF